MVLAHIIDSWTRDADRKTEAFYTLFFIGGVASPLFLFLAGMASAMSAASKARREGTDAAGAVQARRRGWEIFALGLVFRVQAQLLGMGPLTNMLKVDMLNTMGLSIVITSYIWQWGRHHRSRIAWLAAATVAVAMFTPLVRATPLLAAVPDPIEAYLRPATSYSAFPLLPWAGFLFAGGMVGALVDVVRTAPRRQFLLQVGIAVSAVLGVWLAWHASFQPSIYEHASFWYDSPTFFFIRLGLVAMLVPAAWLIELVVPARGLQPIAVFGRSSLFVYWIHVEMVYGVIAEPIKRGLPLWGSLVGTALLAFGLYLLVLLKNRLLERFELRGPFRLLAPVIR